VPRFAPDSQREETLNVKMDVVIVFAREMDAALNRRSVGPRLEGTGGCH